LNTWDNFSNKYHSNRLGWWPGIFIYDDDKIWENLSISDINIYNNLIKYSSMDAVVIWKDIKNISILNNSFENNGCGITFENRSKNIPLNIWNNHFKNNGNLTNEECVKKYF
jgi:nitrous oxidase accessory protein NosD